VQTFAADRWYGEIKAFLAVSTDSGKTFSEPSMMPGHIGNVVMRQTIELSNGDWLTPCYWQEHFTGFGNEFTRAKHSDGGLWTFCTGAVVATDKNWNSATVNGRIHIDGQNFWEPNAIEVAPGHVVMFLRASAGLLHRTDSYDFGRTWSDPKPTDIPNADTKFTLLKVDETVVLINNSTRLGRSLIELWTSRDGCESWDTKIELARLADPNKSSLNEHYIPNMVCYPDGFVDDQQKKIYVAFEDGSCHYMIKIPFVDFM
jgi:plastocyanin